MVKIVIDPSNPIASLPEGGFKKAIGEGQSAGELMGASLPEGVRLVKALRTLGAQSLSEGAFAGPRKVLFYASDCPSVQEDMDELITDGGVLRSISGDWSTVSVWRSSVVSMSLEL